MRFQPGQGFSVGDFRLSDEWLAGMADLLVGHGYLTYRPGNGTQYDMVLVQVHENHWLLAVTNFGTCMWLTEHDRWVPHETYVSERLMVGVADAMAICNLLEFVGKSLAERRVQS